MKVYRTVIIFAAIICLSACSHMKPPPGLSEDQFAIPVEEPSEGPASPGSLWTPGAKFTDMYSDARAHRVGDIVVVQIVESSSANKEAKTEADRTSSMDNSITDVLGLPLDRSSVLGYGITPSVSASSASEFEGEGKTSRKGTISGTVSARVERVLPSGNMVIRGKKQTRVNSENQYIIVSGIIRSEDISVNNTIQSTYIADMQLDYYGSGIIGDQQSKGFIARAIDKVWPF